MNLLRIILMQQQAHLKTRPCLSIKIFSPAVAYEKGVKQS